MKINKTIKLLLFADIFVVTGFGLIDPILAVFINDNLIGGSIFTAGLASTLFLITKSIIQLPFSRYVDKYNDNFDIKWLIIGMFIITAVPVIYLLSKNIYHIYLAQIIFGIGSGFAYPCWLGLWSTHLDKKKESFEWSLYSAFVSLGTGLSAAVGGAIAEYMGFSITFIFVGAMSFIGCLILLYLRTSVKFVTYKEIKK